MVPPMFFGEVPEAVILEKYDVSEHLNRVKGDIAESKVYHALKNYYKRTGDDVLVVHSHVNYSIKPKTRSTKRIS